MSTSARLDASRLHLLPWILLTSALLSVVGACTPHEPRESDFFRMTIHNQSGSKIVNAKVLVGRMIEIEIGTLDTGESRGPLSFTLPEESGAAPLLVVWETLSGAGQEVEMDSVLERERAIYFCADLGVRSSPC